MSKAFGLAGVRVGFGVARQKVIDVIEKIKPPFNINAVGLVASVTALEDKSYREATIKAIKDERKRVFSELQKIDGIKVYQSDANFLFMNVKYDGFNSENVFVELLKKGILVRNCSSFEMCEDKFLRVTIGTPEQNTLFLDSLKEILKD
ncbi:unnamed protein product [marine sediment metagenome]|uniref:Aminotransferase class I/classII large domain-containing protein n=1 Tax=marine sediment metagenome TaxID=412755 RepID=X1AUH2_9ZZZZ